MLWLMAGSLLQRKLRLKKNIQEIIITLHREELRRLMTLKSLGLRLTSVRMYVPCMTGRHILVTVVFPEKIIFNEDMVYASKAMKNGYAVEYCAKARVYHSHNYSFREQFRRNFDMGVSQKDYEEVFSGIKSESEGIKMVVSAAEYMMDNGHWYDIPHLFINSAAKYTGYRLGKMYKHLGKKIILKLTSNKEYWESLEE